jgi:hypothetical protein
MVLGSGIRDPGSGKKPIPDRGFRGQKGTGSRIRNTGLLIFFHRLSNESFKIHLPQLSNTKKKERALIDNEYIL